MALLTVQGFIKHLDKANQAVKVLKENGLLQNDDVKIFPVECIHKADEDGEPPHEGTEYMITVVSKANDFHQTAKIIGDHDEFQPAEVYGLPA